MINHVIFLEFFNLLLQISLVKSFLMPPLPSWSRKEIMSSTPLTSETCTELRSQRETPLVPRKVYLDKVFISIAGVATLSLDRLGYCREAWANDPAYGPKGDPKSANSWFPLLKLQYKAITELGRDWDSIAPEGSTDGDAYRRKLGTVGVSSPLSALKKTFVGIKDSTDIPDDIELSDYVDAYQAVLTDLSDAENDLYSANFAEFSGGGQLKGSTFIKKAKKSVKLAIKNFDDVMTVLNLK